MSDCEDSNDSNWVLYRDRPEWRDVKPVPQDDGPDPIVAIAYSEKFKDVYDYFRAVLKNNEKSVRAMNLTKDAVEINAANYTVWQYRRDILQELKSDLIEELNYVSDIIESHAKNYQVWHHRRVIVEWLNDPSQELELTSNVLSDDPKNYHAWQHRQWVIKTYNLFERELEFVELLLQQDVRNNSAWNQRYFIIANTSGFTDIVVQSEVCFTVNKIKQIKNNESAWNYLRGVLFHDKRGLSGNSIVTAFCEELFNSSNRSPYLLALIIDICEDVLSKGEGGSVYNAQRAKDLCTVLAEKHDVIRAKYWNYISSKFVVNTEQMDVDGENAKEAVPVDENIPSEGN